MRCYSVLGLAILLSTACASIDRRHSGKEQPAEPSIGSGLLSTDDPYLAELILLSADSFDVELAGARLDEAVARAKASRALLAPVLSGEVSSLRRKTDASDTSDELISAGLMFEPDLRGTLRFRSKAARLEASLAEAERDLAQLLAREAVINLYVSMRVAQAQLEAAQRGVLAAQESLELASARYEAGLDTALAVAQARTALETARARALVFDLAITASREQLGAFFPQSLSPERLSSGPVPALIFAGPQVDLMTGLMSRPDVRVAEARSMAAGLNAKAARRDRLPKLSISALVSDGSSGMVIDLTTSVLVTLFDFGRLAALAEAESAVARQASILLEKTLRLAAADISTSAIRVQRAEEIKSSRTHVVSAARKQSELAHSRYASGLSDFLTVLLADQSLSEAEISLAEAEGEVALAHARLQTSLGTSIKEVKYVENPEKR